MTVWGIVVGWAITVWVISSVLSRIGEAIGLVLKEGLKRIGDLLEEIRDKTSEEESDAVR